MSEEFIVERRTEGDRQFLDIRGVLDAHRNLRSECPQSLFVFFVKSAAALVHDLADANGLPFLV